MRRIHSEWTAQLWRQEATRDNETTVWNPEARITLVPQLEEHRPSVLSVSHVAGVTIQESSLAEAIETDQASDRDDAPAKPRWFAENGSRIHRLRGSERGDRKNRDCSRDEDTDARHGG